MLVELPVAVADSVLHAAHAGLDDVALRTAASAALAVHVGFDLAVWATVDPLTAMWTSCVLDGAPRDIALEHAVFDNEYTVPDVLKLRDLTAPEGIRRGALSVECGGDPRRSARFRDVLAPRGFTDEIRTVFHDGRTAWGALVLLRSQGTFASSDVDALSRLERPFADRIRTALLARAGTATSAGTRPGFLFTGADGRVADATAEAVEALAAIDPGDVEVATGALLARFRAEGAARAAIRSRDGARWFGLDATRLGDRPAIIVDELNPLEMAELVVAGVGLTSRERDVLTRLVAGDSNRQIARTLAVSEHTVGDHVKSVLAKFGVGSRAQLVSQIFFAHYRPFHDIAWQPSPRGHFLGAV